MEAAKDRDDIILFIDEFHTSINAGKSADDDTGFSDLLKSYLNDGRVKVIGATTNEEYERAFSQDPAYKRRFIKVIVEEPKKDVLFEIIKKTIKDLEDYHSIRFDFDDKETPVVIDSIIELTSKSKHALDIQNNPDISIDIFDGAFACASLEDNSQGVNFKHIEKSIRSNTRLSKVSRNRMADSLHDTIIENDKRIYTESRTVDTSISEAVEGTDCRVINIDDHRKATLKG